MQVNGGWPVIGLNITRTRVDKKEQQRAYNLSVLNIFLFFFPIKLNSFLAIPSAYYLNVSKIDIGFFSAVLCALFLP